MRSPRKGSPRKVVLHEEEADPDEEARLRLRGTVPRKAQRFAGAVVGNMRDSGFDDRDIVQVLLALFPKKRQQEEVTQATLRRAWAVFGGGELVRTTKVAHDFKNLKGAGAGPPQPLQREASDVGVTSKMRQEQRRRELEAAQLHAQSKQQVAYTASRQLLKSEFEKMMLLLLGAVADDDGGGGGGGGEGEAVEVVGGGVSQEQLQRLFSETDADGDGEIDFAEFSWLFRSLSEGLSELEAARSRRGTRESLGALLGGEASAAPRLTAEDGGGVGDALQGGGVLTSILRGAASLGAFEEVVQPVAAKPQDRPVDPERAPAASKGADGDAGDGDAGGGDAGGGEWAKPAARIWAGVSDLVRVRVRP